MCSSFSSSSHPPQDSLFASQEKFFQDLFDSELASQASAEFEKAMKELAEEEPHLVEQFQKLSEAAGRVGEKLCQFVGEGRVFLGCEGAVTIAIFFKNNHHLNQWSSFILIS